MADKHLDWKPRTEAWKRLAADPSNWSAYSPGDDIGVYLGNCWRKGVFIAQVTDGAIVEAARLGTRAVSQFSVHDARNICAARDLTRTEKEEEPSLFDGGVA
jgi:hypothetical protein